MGLEPKLQTQLYEQFWRPMEVDFGQEGYATHFDGFMRHYLTVKTGEIPNVREVYEAFKEYSRSEYVTSVEALLADLREYANYYCAMALGAEKDPDLKMVFHDIRELKVDVAFPFLLELYHDYTQHLLSKDELLEAACLVESYVFRRAVCGIPTNSLNKIFPTFTRGLKKDRYLESIKANFLLLLSYRRFPGDEEFKRELQVKICTIFHAEVIGFAAWKTMAARNAFLLMNTQLNIFFPRMKTFQNNGKMNSEKIGNGFNKPICTHWATLR